MEIVPAINCATRECAGEKIKTIQHLGVSLMHVDITDGKFSETATWHDAAIYIGVKPAFEVHLMVLHPELVIDEWLAAGARRVIVHIESLMGRSERIILDIKKKCVAHHAELVLSENPHTEVKELLRYAHITHAFHLLAVNPGPSGQKFNTKILKKIGEIKKEISDATIEVDGGVNPDIVRVCKDVGATHAVAASFIFGSENPEDAFRALRNA